jgi:hypothetical protein
MAVAKRIEIIIGCCTHRPVREEWAVYCQIG